MAKSGFKLRGPFEEEVIAPPKKPIALSEQKHWIHFQILDEDTGQPLSGVTARLRLPTGEVREVTSDSEGRVRVQGLPGGSWDLHHLEFSEILEVTKSG